MDPRRYNTITFSDDTSAPLPHEFPSFYPQRSPVVAHLAHRAYFRDTDTTDQHVRVALRRLLHSDAQANLDRVLSEPLEGLVQKLLKAIENTQTAWGDGLPE
jgi:hypothetical protein